MRRLNEKVSPMFRVTPRLCVYGLGVGCIRRLGEQVSPIFSVTPRLRFRDEGKVDVQVG